VFRRRFNDLMSMYGDECVLFTQGDVSHVTAGCFENSKSRVIIAPKSVKGNGAGDWRKKSFRWELRGRNGEKTEEYRGQAMMTQIYI